MTRLIAASLSAQVQTLFRSAFRDSSTIGLLYYTNTDAMLINAAKEEMTFIYATSKLHTVAN